MQAARPGGPCAAKHTLSDLGVTGRSLRQTFRTTKPEQELTGRSSLWIGWPAADARAELTGSAEERLTNSNQLLQYYGVIVMKITTEA